KTVKWGAPTVATLVLALWISSGWWHLIRFEATGRAMTNSGIQSGIVFIDRVGLPTPLPWEVPSALQEVRHWGLSTQRWSMYWWFRVDVDTPPLYTSRLAVALPLWAPALLLLLAGAFAWRADAGAARRLM